MGPLARKQRLYLDDKINPLEVKKLEELCFNNTVYPKKYAY